MRTRQRMARAGCALVMAALSSVALTEAQSTDAAKASGGPREGIKVHGHWTIEIKNADGTLVKRHEFENALLPLGAQILARLLARLDLAGPWAVRLESPFGTANCRYVDHDCALSENRWIDQFGTGDNGDLTVSVPNPGQLMLTGFFTSPNARSFTRVTTEVRIPSSGASHFTQKDLSSTPISVQAGQIVQVTIVISFS